MTKNYTTDNQHNHSFLRGLLPPKGWLVLFLFMMFSSASVRAFDIPSGTYYFDNSQTNWTNVYIFIGHGSYLRSYQMTSTGNAPNVFSYALGSTWGGATAFYFANNDGGISAGSGSYNVSSSKNGFGSNNPTGWSANITSTPTAGDAFVPYSTSNNFISRIVPSNANLTAPTNVVSGTNVMFYIYQNYTDGLGVTNNSSSTCITTVQNVDFSAGSSNYNHFIEMAASNVPSTLSVTDNCGGWSGDGAFASQTSANAAGARYFTGSGTDAKTNATAVTTSASSTTISVGTASIDMTATHGSGVTSSYGRNMYVQYYIGGTYYTSSAKLSGGSTVVSLNTSGLGAGTYTIQSVITDRIVYYKAADITLTVSAAPTAPVVAATAINDNNIDATTAEINGNVTSDGGSAVTERGIVYGTSSNPTTANTKVTAAGTTGTYTSNMTGLTPGTMYYVRSFATNAIGTTYGTEVSFNTMMPPTSHSVVSASTTSLTVSWTRWTGSRAGVSGPYNVMIVRSTDATFTAPTNGSAYVAGNTIGGDTVVYNGAGTSFTDTGLTTGTTYYYALYSEGWSYYSNAASTINAAPLGVVSGAKIGINFNGAGDVWRYTGAQDACDNGSGVWGGTNLGTMYTTGTLVVSGSNMVASTGTTSPTLYYRVYKQGDTPPSFSTYSLSTTAACGGNTKYESTNDITISAASYSVAGTYNFEVYHQGTNGGTINMGTSGSPYTATFVVNAITAPTLAATTINSNIVAATSASIASNITADNGASVTERGIVYATTTTPTTSNTKVTNGTGTGTYNTTMSSLTPNTLYYVRSYAINSAGTSYGTQTTFTTLSAPTSVSATNASPTSLSLAWTKWSGDRAGSSTPYNVMVVRSTDNVFTAPTDGVAYTAGVSTIGGDLVIYNNSGTSTTDTGLTTSTTYYYAFYSEGYSYYSAAATANAAPQPIVATLAATSIDNNNVSKTSASIASNITDNGGAAVTERGVVYKTSTGPTTSDTKVTNGTGSGAYNTSITGLTSGTRYYVRSYAINSAGTAYGAETSFTALSSPTGFSATPITASTIDLAWTKWTGDRAGSNTTYDVMVVRSTDASFTAPTDGVAYTAGVSTIGGDLVIYKGSGTSVTDTGLTLSTQYYYAIYSEGWSYYSPSATANATTPAASVPTLAATTAQTNVTSSNADSGGNVTADGGATVTERGLVFGTSSNPTLSNGTKVTTTGTTGSYTLGLSNLLSPSTTYYVRAYATNAAGTGYGTQITFTTSAASSSTSFYSDRIYFKNGSGADEKYFAAYNVVPNGGCTGNNTETVGTTGWNGRNLGTYTTGTVAKLGGFIVTKGIQNGNTPYMNYRVYETGTTPPSWTSQNMNYVGECVADGVDVNGSSQDKIWRFPLTSFTVPSAPGNYTVEVYFSRSGDHMGANGDQFINNGGNNYKAFLTVERTTGIFSAKVALKKNSDSTAWYNANADTDCDPGSSTDFNNLNNIIVASDGFTLGGNFIATMAMTSPRLFYTLYAEGARPTSPTFTAINLTTSTTPSCSGTVYKYELGATTQLFASNTYTSGTYVLEVYFQGTNSGTDYYRKQDTSTNFKCYFSIPEPNDGNLNPTGTNISGIYESYIGQLILGLDDNGNPTTSDRKISKVFDLDGSNGSSNNANFDLGSTNPGVSFKIGMEAKVFTKGTHKACGCSSWYYLYKDGATDPVESDFPLPAAGSTAVLYSQKWGSSARKFILMNSSMSWQGLNTPFQELGGSSVTGYGDNSPGFGSSTPDGTYNGQLGASATVTKFKDYKDRDGFSPASTNMAVDTPVNEVACPTCDGAYRIAVAFLCWVQTDSTKKCPDDSGFSTTTDAPTIIYHRDINQNKIHNGVYLNPRHPSSPYFTSNKNSLPGTSVFYVSKIDVNASGGDTAYSGSWNNGTPTRGKNTTISSNYSTASGSFTTNNLTIANGVTLTVRAGEYVEVLNTATTTGTGKVVVEKGGNFVQRCNEKIPANGVPYPNIEHTHQTRTIAPKDYVYWSSPIREDIKPTLTTAGMGRMFYWQGGAGGGWRNLSTTAADTFGAGKGFIAWNSGAAPAAFSPTFVGTATNGEVSVTVTKEDVYPDESDAAALATYASNFNNYALLGNPYPCAIDAREFLVHANNQHLGGTVYVWTSNSRLSQGTRGVYDAGDYATYTLTGGTAASNTPEYAYGESSGTTYGNSSSYVADSNRMIYSGSGFFVLVKQNGDAFFNNEMRSITGNSKSSANWALFKGKSDADEATTTNKEENRLWLSVRNEDGAYRQTLLGYFNGATEGFDSYLDAMVNSSNAVNIYTKSKDNHKLVIQARPESLLDANETVPLVLSSKDADDFYITVDMFEGKFKNKDIYLRDKKLGVDHDFSTGKYHFSTESGVYEDRFEIVYKDKPKASIEEPADANVPLKVAVADHLITISKAGQKIAKVELVNILGKQIAEKLYKEPSEKVEIHDIIKANQVLIVNVTYADGSKETKKIIF